MANYNYKVKLHNIKAFAFDVDGVFTDGSLISTIDGELLRTFNAKDCMAVRMCYMKGFPVAIITGGVFARGMALPLKMLLISGTICPISEL